MAYGYRLWLEGQAASRFRPRLSSEFAVGNLITEVIQRAGMTLAAGPLLWTEPKRDIGKGSGVSGVAILIESSVHVHTYPEQLYFFFELFSCKWFDHEGIADYIKGFMGALQFDMREFTSVGQQFPESMSEKEVVLEVKGRG